MRLKVSSTDCPDGSGSVTLATGASGSVAHSLSSCASAGARAAEPSGIVLRTRARSFAQPAFVFRSAGSARISEHGPSSAAGTSIGVVPWHAPSCSMTAVSAAFAVSLGANASSFAFSVARVTTSAAAGGRVGVIAVVAGGHGNGGGYGLAAGHGPVHTESERSRKSTSAFSALPAGTIDPASEQSTSSSGGSAATTSSACVSNGYALAPRPSLTASLTNGAPSPAHVR